MDGMSNLFFMLTNLFGAPFGSPIIGMLVLLGLLCFGIFKYVCWARKTSRKRIAISLCIVLVLVAGLELLTQKSMAYAPKAMIFEGDSKSLQHTQIVPTLDTPIEPDKNVIWCASFQAAWKKLESDVAKEPVFFSASE